MILPSPLTSLSAAKRLGLASQMTGRALQVAALIDTTDPMLEVVTVILTMLNKYCQYEHHNHVTNLPSLDHVDLLVISQIEMLEQVQAHFSEPFPPVLYIAPVENIQSSRYSERYPTMMIYAVAQDPIEMNAGTLKFDKVYQTLRRLQQDLPRDIE